MAQMNHSFKLRLPEGWEDHSVHTFMGPEAFGTRHMVNLVIDESTGDHTVDSYATQRIQMMLDAMPDAVTLKEGERSLASGLPVYEWVSKTPPTDTKAQFHRAYFMIVGGRGYTFTAIFTKASIKTIGVEVEEMINSFLPSQ